MVAKVGDVHVAGTAARFSGPAGVAGGSSSSWPGCSTTPTRSRVCEVCSASLREIRRDRWPCGHRHRYLCLRHVHPHRSEVPARVLTCARSKGVFQQTIAFVNEQRVVKANHALAARLVDLVLKPRQGAAGRSHVTTPARRTPRPEHVSDPSAIPTCCRTVAVRGAAKPFPGPTASAPDAAVIDG